jgi:hypothetical protein
VGAASPPLAAARGSSTSAFTCGSRRRT